MKSIDPSRRRLMTSVTLASAVALSLSLSACSTSEVLNQGYVVDEKTIELVPVGSSREQVLLALGSPSTTATFDNEIFYYISQKRVRPVAFMEPRLVDQKVLAVYFDKDGRVERIANYGLQNGQLFDFISRTTPTGGQDRSFLGQILTDTTSGGAGPRVGQQTGAPNPMRPQ